MSGEADESVLNVLSSGQIVTKDYCWCRAVVLDRCLLEGVGHTPDGCATGYFETEDSERMFRYICDLALNGSVSTYQVVGKLV